MKNIGEFSADSYGMAIISTELLTEYLKEKQCRAKKLLSYFDKNHILFLDSIKDGKFLPFYKISRFEYSIFISVNEENITIPEDYDEVFRYNNFYLEVGSRGRVCIASFSYLEYHLAEIKDNITDMMREVPTGAEGILEKYYPAKGFDLEQGIYEFDLIGLKRKVPTERESKNFAYAFVFRKNAEAKNRNIIKADNDKYQFDIVSYM